MSSETLSQSEIDLLFNGGADDGGVAADGVHGRMPDVRVYDFSRPSLISKERQRALDAMYGMLAKSVEVWLSSRVRTQIEITLMGVDQLSYGEFVMSLPSPCSSYVYDVSGAGAQAVVDFGQEFAYFLVERLLGANGPVLAQQRPLTPLERMLVRIASDRIAEQLNEVWQDHVALGLEMSRFESLPDMIQAASRQDPVLVGNLMVRSGGIESTLMLCLPFSTVEKFFTGSSVDRPAHARGMSRDGGRHRVVVTEHVRNAQLDVAVRLPSFMLTMEEIARLRAGSRLITTLDAQPPAVVLVEERPRFMATIGRAGRNLAARITDTCDAAPQRAAAPHAKVKDMENGSAATANAVQPQADGIEGFEHLLGLSLPVTIELGRTRMAVKDVLDLEHGSIVQLNRLVGEPVDILVGERRFAEGEVVVLGEQFGVRITRILATNGTGR